MVKAEVLIVEDEGIIAKDIENTLKAMGYGVSGVVASAEEAIQKAVETRPNLILMDIVLKGEMDGVEAANQIRARLDIPVIYLTAYADDRTLQRAKITHPFGYLLKPFEEKELLMTIDVALFRHEMETRLKNLADEWELTFNSIGDLLSIHDRDYKLVKVNRALAKALKKDPEELIGQTCHEMIHGTQQPLPLCPHTHALEARQPCREEFYEPRLGVYLEVSSSPIFDQKGELTGTVHIAKDISERKQAEVALRRSEEVAQQLADENSVMAEIGRIISSTLNIEEVYEKFAEEARKLIHFDRIAINLYNSDENTVFVPYVSGLITEDRGPGSVFPLKGSVTEEIVRTRSSLLTDMKTLEEFKDRFPSLISTFQVGMRSMLSVPLISRDSVIGALHYWSKKPDAYTGQDLKLAERIANQIAGAISNAQLFRERERTKEALREREEKYRNILETMEEGYFEVDLKGRFTFFNDSLRKMHRLPREKMLGMSYEEYMSEKTAQKVYKLFNGVYDTGQPVKLVELEIIRGDGKKAILEASVCLFKNAQGERIGFWGVERDITERKRMEETLRESEKKYRQVVENAQELIHITDLNGNFTFANSLTLKAMGYSLDEILNLDYLQLIHPEHRQRLSEIYIKQFRERKASIYVELPIISKSGEIRWLGQNSSLMREGRKVVGFHSVARDITARIKAEEALRKSEERFRLAAESTSDVVYEWDMGNRVQWFGNIDELLGYGPGEFPRTLEAWENSLHPDDRDRVMAAIRNHLEKNEPYGIEYRVRKKDGTYNHWWARGTAVRYGNGNPYRWVGAVADITERKRAEHALAASEERYRTLFEAAGEGILVADVESQQFKYANPAICSMLGYTAEELARLGVAEIHPKEALDHVVAEFEAQARGEKTLSPQIPCLRKDGSVIYTDIATAPVVIDGRKCNVGFFMDITERKRVEEQLRYSEEQFRLLIENSSDLIATIDSHQNISYLSPSVGRMLGYKPEDLIGQNAFWFIHQDDLKLTMEGLAQVIQNPGITKTIEHRLKHGDGSWPIFQTVGSCILDESGKRLIVASSRDITKRKNLESQLAQAQKLEAIGSLAAGIAHEINTPTQYVGDNTRFFKDAFNDLNQLLQKYEELGNAVRAGSATGGVVQEIETIAQKIDLAYLTEEIPKAIHQTLEGVERVTKIVQAMKEFSHPGAKEKTSININKAIKNTITVARNEWKYVAEMVTDLDPSMPLVPCLPGEFNQVILNMIINAAHATADVVGDGSAKKGTITVSTRHDENSAEVRVSDTGTGIPENIRPRIFDPFFTTKKVGKGSGQGLAISHSVIVDKHGGTIHFDTEVGKGTTFIIRLPLENINS